MKNVGEQFFVFYYGDCIYLKKFSQPLQTLQGIIRVTVINAPGQHKAIYWLFRRPDIHYGSRTGLFFEGKQKPYLVIDTHKCNMIKNP